MFTLFIKCQHVFCRNPSLRLKALLVYIPSLEWVGNPKPVFYTDEENILFLITLPCHIEFKGTKSVSKVTKEVSKVSEEEVNLFFLEGIDIQSLSSLIDNDINDVKDYIRALLVSKTGTKSSGKGTKSRISGTKTLALIDMLAFGLKSRVELLTGISLYNKTGNFNNYIKPLLDIGIIEMTLPDKPNSRFQKYRLTEKGKKLLKSE